MIGQLATSKAGHDKDRVYVVMAQEGDFVFLSDGRLRPPDKPKKKRIRHIQPINVCVGEELLGKIREGTKIYAEEIRYALKQYAVESNREEMYV